MSVYERVFGVRKTQLDGWMEEPGQEGEAIKGLTMKMRNTGYVLIRS